MTKRVIMIAALAAGVARTPAHAEPTCLIEVDRKRYLDGPCTVTEAGAGSWLIVRDRLMGQAATIKVDPIISNRGDAAWTGPSGDCRLSEALGRLRREGSCWTNAKARICAWAISEPESRSLSHRHRTPSWTGCSGPSGARPAGCEPRPLVIPAPGGSRPSWGAATGMQMLCAMWCATT